MASAWHPRVSVWICQPGRVRLGGCYSRSYRRRQTDGAFSIETGLELWASACRNLRVDPSGLHDLQPVEKGWFGGRVPGPAPMPRLVSFLRKRKKSTVYGFLITYLSLVELLSIYHGCHDDFPC